MDKAFADLDLEHGLPAGATAKLAASKHIGATVKVGHKTYTLVSSSHLREQGRGNTGAAKIEAVTAKSLFDLVKDDVRLLGIQPCLYDAQGVIKPLSNQEWEMLAVAKLRGSATFTGATTAAKHVVSMMLHEHRATHALDAHDIEPVLFKDAPRKPCWARIGVRNDPLHEAPEAFAEFLKRVKTPGQAESLVRWIGSVLDTGSDRSEYLYLRGDGNDGKSTLISALNTVLSPASQVISTNVLKNDHGSTALEGKRLVIFNEENSATFSKSAELKRITGDDEHLINPKNAALRTALFQCKVIYVSNFEPSLHGLRADKRRIAYVEVGEFTGIDTTFKARLTGQAPDMLRYCWTKYQEWKRQNPKGGKLGDPAALDSIIEESTVSEAEDTFNLLFSVVPDEEYDSSNEEHHLMALDAKRAIKTACPDYAMQVAVKKVLLSKAGTSIVRRFPTRKAPFRYYHKIRNAKS
jgi:energy-coupling factor transporter ATP-binding protein EcfA2